ncbi:hypothetical protein BO70DRAFT_429120 [Aspergillus heteromorphus CBS 117.55]|uniref:Uncharacterized protein n=1 Tax=Aspergillus heteromorphus CBS 117.55 TaxID=1448321 RepID=A0A317WAI0_9EURO|nr:uncharacterized protein BO70DRAFT_429120 [Aspergillus heteromorphus CBS 117.55]PWY82008.1 hypothetical protein BO70DRAFT_429120 [Aspergillus heteromorphus CBS 117.55]
MHVANDPDILTVADHVVVVVEQRGGRYRRLNILIPHKPSATRDPTPRSLRNVIAWVRRLGPQWTVRVLDEANLRLFLDAAVLPGAVNQRTMDGPSAGPHTADLIRLPLLYRYGGVWMDVGTLLFICWRVLADPATPYEMTGCHIDPDREGAMGRVTDYIAQMHCFERLRKLVDPTDGFNGPAYYTGKIYVLPALDEMYYFQKRTGWNGGEQFGLLRLQRDGEGAVHDLAYARAEEIEDSMLANSARMKLSHGPPGELDARADLWDEPQYEDRDIQPGTFAAHLRHASANLTQTRQLVPLKVKLETENVLHAGVLEVKIPG